MCCAAGVLEVPDKGPLVLGPGGLSGHVGWIRVSEEEGSDLHTNALLLAKAPNLGAVTRCCKDVVLRTAGGDRVPCQEAGRDEAGNHMGCE